LWRNRTDGALVRVTTPVNSHEAELAADERIQEFVRQAEPLMAPFVPK
jgi:hypothetical protein